MIQVDIEHILILLGIPTALTAFFFWNLERRIKRTENERREREKAREELMVSMIQTSNAALALSEATAKAVQRIPDAHCNGDMHAALDYAAKVKHAQKEFLTAKGIQAILE